MGTWEVVGWERGRAAGREGVRGDWGAGVGFGVQGRWGGVRTGCRAGIWGAVLGFEGQGRRGMQCCVQTWDLGCREGLGCKHRNWGSGGNLGCRGRSGVQTRVAKGDLGYRKKSRVQGEIWGCRPRTWGSEVDLGCSGRFGVWEAIWGCRGRFWAHTWGCRCPSLSRGRAVPRGKSGPGPGGLLTPAEEFQPGHIQTRPFFHFPFCQKCGNIPPQKPDPTCPGRGRCSWVPTPGWSTLR